MPAICRGATCSCLSSTAAATVAVTGCTNRLTDAKRGRQFRQREGDQTLTADVRHHRQPAQHQPAVRGMRQEGFAGDERNRQQRDAR